MMVALAAMLAALGLGGAPADAVATLAAWPPPLDQQQASRFDFVHYGENHHNEDGGPVINGAIFKESNLYGAAFLANSSDMATTGDALELGSFKRYITQGISPICPGQEPCQSKLEIPWFHSMGNHDRQPIAGPGGVASFENGVYRTVFKDQAFPWGEDPSKLPAGFTVPSVNDTANRKPGAATHYAVDYGQMRLIALDNSPHSFTTADALSLQEEACGGCRLVGQNPPVGPTFKHASQLAFLIDAVRDAKANGMLVFVVMHQPTTDPRYPGNVAAISTNHTMNKGATTDNKAFEVLAGQLGVNGVLLGHIKGSAVYDAFGVPYYVDGGGGGNPYAADSGGIYSVDYGTYYGYRLFRIEGGTVQGSYLIPIVDRFELSLGGAPVGGVAAPVSVGAALRFGATGVQPACTKGAVASIGFKGCSGRVIRVEMRPPSPPLGFEGAVPRPAYVWHTSNPSVVAPAAGSGSIDPNFDPATMSVDGRFVAVGAGTAEITIVSGWSRATVTVTVTG